MSVSPDIFQQGFCAALSLPCPERGEAIKKHVHFPRRKFEDLVDRAMESLPEEFLRYLENVAILIEDEPPPELGRDTLGLYDGVPLSQRGAADTIMPDRIILFRGPIERACYTPEEVENEVRETVLHEVGHFFGLDEPDLR